MAAGKLTSRFGDGNSSVGGSWDRGPFGAATSGFSPGPRCCYFRRHHTIKWLSKVHYAHIQLDDASLSNIVYWGMKSKTGSVDAYPIPCNPQFQLQQTNHSQDCDIKLTYLGTG